MKNLEFKMRLSLLIGGLALMVCCGLQGQAQTNDAQEQSKEWGIWVTQKGKDSYLFPGKGRPLFRGTKEQCVQKCKELNAQYADNGKRTAREVGEKVGAREELIQQAQVEEEKLVNTLLNLDELPKYSPTIIAEHGSLFFTEEECKQAANDWQKKQFEMSFAAFVQNRYSNLCKKHGFIENEKDMNHFKKRIIEITKNNQR